jgi:sugar/nucleoside kinase (ribokinase family)
VACAVAARSRGTRIAVDLSSASMIRTFGPARFRQLWQSLDPSVVFANDDEWHATHEERGDFIPPSFGAGGRCVLALKHGRDGCSFVIDGISDDRPAVSTHVVDATGAGDSLTAGYLVGGIELAMRTAARCISHLGAQPSA